MITKKKNIYKISRGPQFKTRGAVVFAFAFLFTLFLSFYFLIAIELILSGLFFLISILFFYVILDIHAVEIDIEDSKIRDYFLLAGYKVGKWETLKGYKYIGIFKDKTVIPTTEYSDHPSDTYYYYLVKLIDDSNKKELLLREYKDLINAQILLKKVSGLLKIKDITK